jgi:hypothetical protein
MEYPQVNHLYKYCAYTPKSLCILQSKKIWVPKPESLNDPFDCNINFTPKIKPGAVGKLLNHKGGSTGNPQKDKEAFLKILNEFREKDVKNLGVFSMSKTNDDILMWTHYADQHKGFCIGFVRKPDNLLGDITKTQPVEYDCNYPEVNPMDENGNADFTIFRKMLFTKAKNWEYENEWRFLYDEGDKVVPFPADISSIIFGLKMPDEHKVTIRKILADQPNIRYQEAIKVEYQFRLKIIDCKANK